MVKTNIPSKFEGPSPKHCQVIKLLSTKGPGNLVLCPEAHLLVRTNISTKFEGPNHKHCKFISLFGTKGHGDLDLWLKGHLLFRSIFTICLIVLGLIIANGLLLSVQQVALAATHTLLPPTGRGLFSPQGNSFYTSARGPLGNATYQISNA